MKTVGDRRLRPLVERVLAGQPPDAADAAALADLARGDGEQLLAAAWRVRRRFFGRAVRMCSIAAGKLGGCGEDCAWCAQSHRSDTQQGPRTVRTPVEDVLAAARRTTQAGAAGRFGIVNSGRRPTDADIDAVIDALDRIGADGSCDVRLCASLGEITESQARRLAAAGLDRYHHNLETSREMFPHLVTGHTYDDRLATLAAARRGGLGLCCGGLFGLGESWEDRISLALTLGDQVRPDCVPLNFLQPIPGTAMENQPPLGPDECLTIIATFRLLLPTTDIKVAGGREFCLGDQQHRIFHAGATSCMTGGYLTTTGQSTAEDLKMVAEMGFNVVSELPPVD